MSKSYHDLSPAQRATIDPFMNEIAAGLSSDELQSICLLIDYLIDRAGNHSKDRQQAIKTLSKYGTKNYRVKAVGSSM